MMNLLIVGCGRVGAMLASIMSENGHDVSIVDKDKAAFSLLDDNFNGLTFEGVPIDSDTLLNAGIESCDAVCALTQEDDVNIMVAQLAQNMFHVPTVITHVLDPEKEDVFEEFGLNTLCPTRLCIDTLVSMLTHRDDNEEEQKLNFSNHTVKFYTMPIPEEYYNMPCSYIELEKDEILYGIISGETGKLTLARDFSTIMHEGDKLIFSKLVD